MLPTTEPCVRLNELLAAHANTLHLRLLSGDAGLTRVINSPRLQKPSLAFAGFTAHIDDFCMQVIGKTEMDYLATLPSERQLQVINDFFNLRVAAVVITHQMAVPSCFLDAAQRTETPLLTSALSSTDFMINMTMILSKRLAPVVNQPGVFLDIFGQGVLLRAASGLGKSEVALELITRGHRLVADDTVNFRRESTDTLVGRCPELSQDMLEVRGIGLVNVRHLFGSSAITRSKKVTLVVRLIQHKDFEHDRISSPWKQETIHGVNIPMAELPVLPGRSLAVLVEAVTRIHIHQQQGNGDDRGDFLARIDTVAAGG